MHHTTSPRSRWGAAAGAALVLAALAVAPAASAATSPRTTLCQKVSLAEVSKALGVKATKVSTTLNGSVTVCWYQVGKNKNAVFVRTQTHDNAAGYNNDFKLAQKYGEHPKSVSNFKPYPAFTTWIGSASYGYTYSVTVLKKTTELGVGATGTTLAKVEALTAKVLPVI